ncbi:glycosyltransferase family 4 protein [Lichenicola cladoniae]|uniref:Glycosyltransferase family 4 protein n=1 Tax=Lichenicola cladoniae TaxID=1484109 RepID=A0A6M8HP97_9PROT|nr:glycosyltransferase family 1 protein [Lichenicola cladoniae]NPD68330.1 glycosyltransferase family 4 protein [Acetobacteraceae bacterium]QKE90168.1 glycosyltransferase family 4 protein [Lichenicola cladoniae]
MNVLGRAQIAPFVTLDLSRLLSRAGADVPTGIDRVELAYAVYLLSHAPERVEFVALHPLGRFGSLPFDATARFVEALAARWDAGVVDDTTAVRLGRRLLHGLMLPRSDRNPHRPASGDLRRRVYLLLSHHHLTRPAVVAQAIAKRGAAFVPMVHDLIPLEFPEYSREREPARHASRIDTVVRQADAVLVPSEAVRGSLLPYLERAGRPHVPVWVIPHGVHLRALPNARIGPDAATGPVPHPYFICLGTIEARKNHLLLLNLWRRLVEEHGEQAPHLVLIGKRGWENEQVLDMIERCPALKGVVKEHNALPDEEVVRLLKGARALLFPSFAEGYGLPLAEALSLGVPAICSDIPVFREVGGGRPYMLDPLDTMAWKRKVEAFTGNDTDREAQRASLRDLPVPGWDDSVRSAMQLIDGYASNATVAVSAGSGD